MGLYVVEWLIENCLVPGETEAETARVFSTSLLETFSRPDGYTIHWTVENGKANLITTHVVLDTRHDEYEEKIFFVIQCKAPGLERQSSVWDEVAENLREYLGGITSDNRKFGAVAIGKLVRFYEFDEATGSLVDFDGDGTVYQMDLQCQAITEKFMHFREHYLILFHVVWRRRVERVVIKMFIWRCGG